MANEVTAVVSLQISKNGVLQQLSKTVNRDLAGSNQISNVQTIGTSAELLTISDLGNIARLAVMNLSVEFPVALGLDVDADPAFALLQPGDMCYIPCPAALTQIYAKATGGNADIAFLACET